MSKKDSFFVPADNDEICDKTSKKENENFDTYFSYVYKLVLMADLIFF
jgi:hypothetical protein